MCADRKHPADIIFERHPGPAENLESRPPLTKRDLRLVVRAVHDVVDKWEGIALCLKVETIDKIKKEYRGPEKRMIAILSAWLNGQTLKGSPDLTWKSVVRVVADRVGGENPAHAERILLNYNKFHTPSEMAAKGSNSPLVPPGASNAEIRAKATGLQGDLGEVEHRWYQLGVLLGLPVHILDGFQENYDDLSDRLRAMLQEWLKKGNTEEYEKPSWQVLVNAVEHSAGGGNPRLAGELVKASAPVPTVQSPTQPSSSTPSGQQSSMFQTQPTQQQQNPQIAIPNQVQQPLGPQAPGPSYQGAEMASGENSPEYKTLRELSSTLQVGVQSDLSRIVTEAFSCGLFGANERDDVLDVPVANHRKAATLIRTVLSKVHGNPGYFTDFRDILNKEVSQRHLVKQLDDKLVDNRRINKSS